MLERSQAVGQGFLVDHSSRHRWKSQRPMGFFTRHSLHQKSQRWALARVLAMVPLLVSPCLAIDQLNIMKATSPLDLVGNLSSSGKALMRQCQAELRNGKSRKEAFHDGLTWQKWDKPKNLPESPHHEDLGWTETSGTGLIKAPVNTETCFLVSLKNKAGEPFDQGCLQRAYLMANLTSLPREVKLHINAHPGQIRFAADVTYLANVSMHRVCYTPPNPGKYQLEVFLMFSNAFHILTGRDPEQVNGFANYTTLVNTNVSVTAGKYFSMYLFRKRYLPECTLDILAESRNKGFWIGHTWLPQACRLRRLAPFEIMKWLNGKNILFLGDSEMRYLYGLFQVFLSMRSRSGFLTFLYHHPWHRGSKLEVTGVPGRADPGPEPPREPGSNLARHIPYALSTGYSVYFGGRYSGFGRQRLQFRAIPRTGPKGPLGKGVDVDINITYVSFFQPSDDLFYPWMEEGKITGGLKAYDGRPYDVVIEGCLLHGVLEHDSPMDYGKKLASSFVPRLKKICPQPRCTFASFGPLTGMEAWKPTKFVHISNNARNNAFEDEAYRVFRKAGLRNMLHVGPVTVPVRGSELAADPAHFRAPVSLAMMDLVFGALIGNTTGPII